MRGSRWIPALALAGAFLTACPAPAATDMLTAAGTATAPTTSSCPATSIATCASGWFRIAGAKTVVVKVNATAGTNTVILDHRADSTDAATSTLYTWTNADATTVGRAIVPAGEVRVRVTALAGGGTVKAKLEATSMTGGRLW